MILNEDYFDKLEIDDEDIIDNLDDNDDILEEPIQKQSNANYYLKIEYTEKYHYYDYSRFVKTLLVGVETIIKNTQLFNDAYIRLFVSKEKHNGAYAGKYIVSSKDGPDITSQNCDEILKDVLKKTSCLISFELDLFFIPPTKMNFKKFCDDMYILYARIMCKHKHLSATICEYKSNRNFYSFIRDSRDDNRRCFFDFLKMEYIYKNIYKDIDIDYFDLTKQKYNIRYNINMSCIYGLPYITKLIKLAKKPDLFDEYVIDIKGYSVFLKRHYIAIGLIPKSEEYNKTGLMLDFVYKYIVCCIFTSFDYDEMKRRNESVVIYVLADCENVEPTNCRFLSEKRQWDDYIDRGNRVRICIRIINNDWRLVDDNGRIESYEGMLESEIEEMEKTLQHDLSRYDE